MSDSGSRAQTAGLIIFFLVLIVVLLVLTVMRWGKIDHKRRRTPSSSMWFLTGKKVARHSLLRAWILALREKQSNVDADHADDRFKFVMDDELSAAGLPQAGATADSPSATPEVHDAVTPGAATRANSRPPRLSTTISRYYNEISGWGGVSVHDGLSLTFRMPTERSIASNLPLGYLRASNLEHTGGASSDVASTGTLVQSGDGALASSGTGRVPCYFEVLLSITCHREFVVAFNPYHPNSVVPATPMPIPAVNVHVPSNAVAPNPPPQTSSTFSIPVSLPPSYRSRSATPASSPHPTPPHSPPLSRANSQLFPSSRHLAVPVPVPARQAPPAQTVPQPQAATLSGSNLTSGSSPHPGPHPPQTDAPSTGSNPIVAAATAPGPPLRPHVPPGSYLVSPPQLPQDQHPLLSIGLVSRPYPSFLLPGRYPTSIAYVLDVEANNENLNRASIVLCCYNESANKVINRRWELGKEWTAREGDTVGVGILEDGEQNPCGVYFTVNGRRIEMNSSVELKRGAWEKLWRSRGADSLVALEADVKHGPRKLLIKIPEAAGGLKGLFPAIGSRGACQLLANVHVASIKAPSTARHHLGPSWTQKLQIVLYHAGSSHCILQILAGASDVVRGRQGVRDRWLCGSFSEQLRARPPPAACHGVRTRRGAMAEAPAEPPPAPMDLDVAAVPEGARVIAPGAAPAKTLTNRVGVAALERTRTHSSASSRFAGSPRGLSPRVATAAATVPPFALEPTPALAAAPPDATQPLSEGDGATGPRKPRSRTRVSGHPNPIATEASPLLQRAVSERDPTKIGTLGHRSNTTAPNRFIPVNQALATTDSQGQILTANDTLCRVLGLSQSEVTGADVFSFLGSPYREKQRRFLAERGAPSGNEESMLVSGAVVSLVKKDGKNTSASLWLKDKRTLSGTRVLMWVLEPIMENNVTLAITRDGRIMDASGACEEMFGFSEDELMVRRLWDLLPALKPWQGRPSGSPANSSPTSSSPASGGPFDLEQIDRYRFFGAVTRQGITLPVIAKISDSSPNNGDLEFFDEENHNERPSFALPPVASAGRSPNPQQTYPVTIISMPNIAGVVTVGPDGLIQSCNALFAKYLFGMASKDLVNKVNITALIPQFWTLVNQIGSDNLRGHTVAASFSQLSSSPTREFSPGSISQSRSGSLEAGKELSGPADAFVRISGVIAYHRDGTPFNIDLQIRVIHQDDEVAYVLSISYDRYADKKAAILAQHVKAAPGTPAGSPTHARGLSTDANGLLSAPAATGSASSSAAPAADQVAQDALASTAVRLRRMSVSIDHSAKSINDFKVLDTLGEGAYGFVSLCERVKEDPDGEREKVVIKYVIKARILVDTWIRDRDLGVVPMEIHVLNYLRKNPHPCIVRILDYWEDSVYFYIEMPMLGWGMDLFDYIEITESMTEADIKYIFHQIALAVQHLHRHGIVHRDIKDENVILDENLAIQLIDFGSSAYYKQGKLFDTFCGTLDYASPEVLTGHKYSGPPQDIWALGILLYTMIYRENPFYNIDEIIGHPLRVPFVMSPESLDLIRSMLQRDVHARPTIDEVLSHVWFRKNPDASHTPMADVPP
ncbi:hypothetical protein DFJ74DRAFT_756858 [Hyaloraphidium curvatum]|nr:hypothetical protein DFJ74DRAFT_756858 [Hyaloraphidium curvatum]